MFLSFAIMHSLKNKSEIMRGRSESELIFMSGLRGFSVQT
jgi:hypothetical protein